MGAVCSNRAATRVNDLKARERRREVNTGFCSGFANSRKLQQSVAPPLHGGGQGFESPRLHLWYVLICRKICAKVDRPNY
jgi:hypothetical protein